MAVNIFTADALLLDTVGKLGNVVKIVTEGSEDPEVWKAMGRLKTRMIREAQQLERDITALERHNGKA
jgi:hypothetical protein